MGELVAIDLVGGPDFVDALKRIWDDGDAACPLDVRLPHKLRRYALRSVRASRVIDRSGDTRLDAGQPVDDGDALVVSTSGTTGAPKAAVITHDALRASAEMTRAHLDITRQDHWLACLPLNHIGGLAVVTRAIVTGTRLTVTPRYEETDANLVSLVTAMLPGVDTGRYRAILLGGGPVPAERPVNAIATYGMTETAGGVVYDGYPLPGVELRTSEDGVIEIKSPTALRCYRDGTNPIRDGWLPTGDAGNIDDSGRLTVRGRLDDVIITGGEKVWPQAVEAVIARHPRVRAVVVHGVDDDRWGRRVVASIESTEPPGLDEIREWAKEQLPAYCAPKELRVVEQLPRTTSGKLIRPTSKQ